MQKCGYRNDVVDVDKTVDNVDWGQRIEPANVVFGNGKKRCKCKQK